jgi:hypothetical protein
MMISLVRLIATTELWYDAEEDIVGVQIDGKKKVLEQHRGRAERSREWIFFEIDRVRLPFRNPKR